MRYNFGDNYFEFLHPQNTDFFEELFLFLILEHDVRSRHWTPKPNELVVDVGADCGPYTLLALARGAKVIAIEPRYESIQNLARNISMNPGFAKRVKIIQTALSDKIEELCISSEGFKSSTNDSKCKDKIKTQRLDDLHLYNVDWIKIDVEGSELDVLRGANRTIRIDKPKLVVECHLGYDPNIDRKVMSYLHELNPDYEFHISIDLLGIVNNMPYRHLIAT